MALTVLQCRMMVAPLLLPYHYPSSMGSPASWPERFTGRGQVGMQNDVDDEQSASDVPRSCSVARAHWQQDERDSQAEGIAYCRRMQEAALTSTVLQDERDSQAESMA